MKNNNDKYKVLLDKYVHGTITNQEQHDLERYALEDPFVMDALEGYQSEKNHVQTLEELQSKLSNSSSNKRIKLPILYAIAAGFALVLAATLFMQNQVKSNQSKIQTVASGSEQPTTQQEIFADRVDYNQEKDAEFEEHISDGSFKVKTKVEPNLPVVPTTDKRTQVYSEAKNNSVLLGEKESKSNFSEVAGEPENIPQESSPKDTYAETLHKEEDNIVASSIPPQESQKQLLKSYANDQTAAIDVEETTASSLADVRNILGKVIDENEEPIIGANILVKNTNKGSTTDLAGNFNTEVKTTDSFLLVSYVGYAEEEIRIPTDQRELVVTLSNNIMLDEVVVATSDNTTRVMSYILARDGETHAYPVIGLNQFKKNIEKAISNYRSGYNYEIGTVKTTFSLNPSGYINNIQIESASCGYCKVLARKLLMESGQWETHPSNREVEIEYTFDFN